MKVCIAQPKYSTDYLKSDEYFKKQLKLFDQCDESMDIIVFPESADIPCLASTKEESEKSVEKYNKLLLDAASKTARRCQSLLFINARYKTVNGLRNTTFVFDRTGNIVGKYFKQHLVPNEVSKLKLDSNYSFEFEEPTILEIEGIRFAFLTCYDFYFYEAYSNIARYDVDVIIGCSHQRSDTHSAIKIISQFLAYNTNAYVIRSSVSMDENSNIGGGSMVVAPTGEVLVNMYSQIGIGTIKIDIKQKYFKPAGYGNPLAAHYEYIEKGRRPWKYRPAGSAIIKPDDTLGYPRICAHRGFNTIAPENSLPAFGAAVAMGADEIEFDLWFTKDGEIVSCHDSTLDRVSDGTGEIRSKTIEELLQFDFGKKYNEKFKGMKIATFEEILKTFACQTILNVHIKSLANDYLSSEACLKKIVALIKKYDCEKHVYFMSGEDAFHELAMKTAPHINRCMGAGQDPWNIVERAIAYNCTKVQLFKPYFNQKMIETAHENGVFCNMFWSDDVVEAKHFLEMGIDTILTNDYNIISQIIK